LNLKIQSFSLYVASFVLIPAKCFVDKVLSLPLKLPVFSRTVVTVLFCFKNFLAFSFLVIHKVLLGNFRIAMFPIISCGIFFIVNNASKDIKRFWRFVGCGRNKRKRN
jgi:hypothetical protein